jgi:hypothetical protein
MTRAVAHEHHQNLLRRQSARQAAVGRQSHVSSTTSCRTLNQARRSGAIATSKPDGPCPQASSPRHGRKKGRCEPASKFHPGTSLQPSTRGVGVFVTSTARSHPTWPSSPSESKCSVFILGGRPGRPGAGFPVSVARGMRHSSRDRAPTRKARRIPRPGTACVTAPGIAPRSVHTGVSPIIGACPP